jgi:hypothetical protein
LGHAASSRPRPVPRATGDGALDELDDARERHRVHFGEVEAGRIDPKRASTARWRGDADAGEIRHLLDVAAQAQAGR